MQLINEHVGMYDPVKSKYITDEDIFEKMADYVEQSRFDEVRAQWGMVK